MHWSIALAADCDEESSPAAAASDIRLRFDALAGRKGKVSYALGQGLAGVMGQTTTECGKGGSSPHTTLGLYVVAQGTISRL